MRRIISVLRNIKYRLGRPNQRYISCLLWAVQVIPISSSESDDEVDLGDSDKVIDRGEGTDDVAEADCLSCAELLCHEDQDCVRCVTWAHRVCVL
jgi:hypothetical protein